MKKTVFLVGIIAIVTFGFIRSSNALPILYNVSGIYSLQDIDLSVDGTIIVENQIYNTSGTATCDILGINLVIGENGYFSSSIKGYLDWVNTQNSQDPIWMFERGYLVGVGSDGYHEFSGEYNDLWSFNWFGGDRYIHDVLPVLSDSFTLAGHAYVNWEDVARFELKMTTAAPVPEPSTILLLGTGFIGFAWYGRKRKQT